MRHACTGWAGWDGPQESGMRVRDGLTPRGWHACTACVYGIDPKRVAVRVAAYGVGHSTGGSIWMRWLLKRRSTFENWDGHRGSGQPCRLWPVACRHLIVKGEVSSRP
eukprot:1158876-Pelagomonas_calceolata.AAC.3